MVAVARAIEAMHLATQSRGAKTDSKHSAGDRLSERGQATQLGEQVSIGRGALRA